MSSLRSSSSVNRPLLKNGTSYHSASFSVSATSATEICEQLEQDTLD